MVVSHLILKPAQKGEYQRQEQDYHIQPVYHLIRKKYLKTSHLMLFFKRIIIWRKTTHRAKKIKL